MTITDADAGTVRRFYAAVAALDFSTMEKCFAPDAVWHLPGSSAISGDHSGWPAIRDDFLLKLQPLSGGTFRAELLDVAVGEKYVIAVQRGTAEHIGRRLNVTACQLMQVQDGRILDVQGHYSDQRALDAFWARG